MSKFILLTKIMLLAVLSVYISATEIKVKQTKQKINKKSYQFMLPPCHFLLYSSNTIVTLTEETNRSNHSDTKKLDHFKICNIIV